MDLLRDNEHALYWWSGHGRMEMRKIIKRDAVIKGHRILMVPALLSNLMQSFENL